MKHDFVEVGKAVCQRKHVDIVIGGILEDHQEPSKQQTRKVNIKQSTRFTFYYICTDFLQCVVSWLLNLHLAKLSFIMLYARWRYENEYVCRLTP